MIGVIGGNGVAATNKLCQYIEEKITKKGAYRDCHHPEMIIWQATQAPSRSMYLEGRGPSWIEDYVNVGMKLKECGCDQLCMCCNTAHYAVDLLQERIGIPFINILDEVCGVIKKHGYKRIGIMVTDGAKKYRLYDQKLELVCPSAEFIYPDEFFQSIVTKGICNAKNNCRWLSSDDKDSPEQLFERVFEHFVQKECDCVLAGCTDISNAYRPKHKVIGYLDSLEILADAIIDQSSVSF